MSDVIPSATDIAPNDWIASLPKAELHIHIDGSLEASRMLQLAEKNAVELPYKTISDVETAYNFKDLQSFLDLYYIGASVLRDESDFYHLMMDYLLRCRENNIVHTEIMVEPQTYLPNGVGFEVFMTGFNRAIAEANAEWGISVCLILSLLKHCSEQECIDVLNMADPWRDDFVALGMASTEIGNPPEKFAKLYALGKDKGYQLTTHAGEEGSADIIWGSLNVMKAERIDHGVRCTDDPALVTHLADNNIALTVCPLSNVKLKVFDSLDQHNILELLAKGVCVTVNSDDPAYFGGYLNDNFYALNDVFSLHKSDVVQLLKNSFMASYLPENVKSTFVAKLESV